MKFYIRTKKTEGRASLYVDIQKRVPKIKCKVCTPIEVDILEWIASGAEKSQDKQTLFFFSHGLANVVQQVEKQIRFTLDQGKTDRQDFVEAVNVIFYKESRDRAEEAEEKRKAAEIAKKQAEDKERNKPHRYLDRIISEMKRGTRLTEGERYKVNTINTFETLRKHLLDFYPFDWEDMGKGLIDLFVQHLQDKGLMPSTINADIRVLRIAYNMAYEEGIHTNYKGQKAFTQIKVKEDEVRAEIYLTSKELDELHALPIVGELAQVRDVFLVGCYTGQRYSDYSRIKESDFGNTAEGTRVVRIIQQKTGNKVTIPVLSENLETIMRQYDYKLPKFDTAQFNRLIKVVMSILAKEVPTLNELESTALTLHEKKKGGEGIAKYIHKDGKVFKPRWQMVSSHTARRSCVTNLYLTKRLDTLSLMKISGHKSEKAFMRYIRVTEDEYADRIAEAFNTGLNVSSL